MRNPYSDCQGMPNPQILWNMLFLSAPSSQHLQPMASMPFFFRVVNTGTAAWSDKTICLRERRSCRMSLRRACITSGQGGGLRNVTCPSRYVPSAPPPPAASTPYSWAAFASKGCCKARCESKASQLSSPIRWLSMSTSAFRASLQSH